MRVEVDDPVAFAQIGLMVQHAHHHLAPEASVDIVVEGTEALGYRVDDHGDRCADVTSLDDLLDVVYMRIYRRAMELASLKGWLRIHGAVVAVGGRRVAVVGAGERARPPSASVCSRSVPRSSAMRAS